jgi:hypothetical protein
METTLLVRGNQSHGLRKRFLLSAYMALNTWGLNTWGQTWYRSSQTPWFSTKAVMLLVP